ncbi:MAG: NnrS family protein [Bacteriovoracaceae bacterium]|nr:NnrS family protein [Bacteriovoracaceae bacterium]
MKIYNAPFFENSIRALFPLACLSAVFGPAYLVTVLINQYTFKHPFFNIFQWHAYEMLYGFLMTLIAGFLLTAGGAWTGKGAVSGRPILTLFMLWFVDQVLLFFPMPNVLYFIAASTFPLCFIYLCSHLLKGYKQVRIFMFLIILLFVSKLTFIASAIYRNTDLKEFSINSALWVVIVLVGIIAGRVIPNFTKKLLKIESELTPPRSLERFFSISMIATIVWLVPHGQDWLNCMLFLLAGGLSIARLSYFAPVKSLKHPMIGFLHIGYFIYSLSLITLGLGILLPHWDSGRASLHLLAAGGVSIIAINIMTRASLGHTGREIKMTPTIMLSFICIIIGAILRVIIAPIWPELYYPSLHHSMGFWTLSFILFFIKFVPILLKKRMKK